MSKYICLENVLAELKKQYKNTRELIANGETYLDTLAEGYTEAKHIITRIILPEDDVKKVVFCKDCGHRNAFGECCLYGGKMNNYDYCSRGKKYGNT